MPHLKVGALLTTVLQYWLSIDSGTLCLDVDIVQ